MAREPVVITHASHAAVQTLDQVAADPTILARLPLDALVTLRRQLQYLSADIDAAIARQMIHECQRVSEDRLLDVAETARRLGVCTDYVYRHAIEWPFTVRNGRKLGFSEQGLADYLRRQQGRPLGHI